MIQSRSLCNPFYPSDPDTPQLYLHEATSAGGTRGSRNLKVALLSQHLCAAPCRELGCGVLTALQCAGNAYWSPLGLCELWASAASWHHFIRHPSLWHSWGLSEISERWWKWLNSGGSNTAPSKQCWKHPFNHELPLIRGHYVNAKPLLDFLGCS